jgi:hypothetical protein
MFASTLPVYRLRYGRSTKVQGNASPETVSKPASSRPHPTSSVLGFRGVQAEIERRAASWFGFCPDVALVAVHDALDDG